MDKSLGYTHQMGPQLRAEVERQLLKDFQRYSDKQGADLAIDWSNTCPEGHVTEYLDGQLENWSDVQVVNAQGKRIAWGWIDFIHGGGDNPLFVFWLYLHLRKNTEDAVRPQSIPQHIWDRYYLRLGENTEEVVRARGDIPQHIWDSLPENSKDLCLKSDAYDAAWRNDPLVLQWRIQKSQR